MDLKAIAEAARIHFHGVCGDIDDNVAGGWTQPYKRSQALLVAAIAAAYPELDTDEIYRVWVECMESIEHCAAVVRRNGLIEIGPRRAEFETAGGDVFYRKSWTREINGVEYVFQHGIDVNRFAYVTVGCDGVQVHKYEWRVKELPGLVDFSQRLGKLFF